MPGGSNGAAWKQQPLVEIPPNHREIAPGRLALKLHGEGAMKHLRLVQNPLTLLQGGKPTPAPSRVRPGVPRPSVPLTNEGKLGWPVEPLPSTPLSQVRASPAKRKRPTSHRLDRRR